MSSDLTFTERFLGGRLNAQGYPVLLTERTLKLTPKADIVIRRTMAIGDCIASTFLADMLKGQGRSVEFQAMAFCHPALRAVRSIYKVNEILGTPTINLDGAYETDANRNQRHFAESFWTRAQHQLNPLGHKLPPCANYAPVLEHKAPESALEFLSKHRKPWVMISPRSNGAPTRTFLDNYWAAAAGAVQGTCFWLGNHGPAPQPIVDLKCKTFEEVMDWIAAGDFFVGADSGPMHIAAGLGKPILVIHQASNPSLHLSEQRDFSVIAPNLKCLSCNGQTCRVAPQPLCNKIEPALLAKEINRRLRMFQPESISAVVCVYKLHGDRLHRCLQALVHQVDEIIVVGDQASIVPSVPTHPKVRFIRHWRKDMGYGRKANYGVRNTSGAWVMLVNDDVYLEKDVISKLKDIARADDKVGIVGHMLRFPDGRIQHGGTGRDGTGRGWMHLDHKQVKSRFEAPVELENVTGASIMVRREAFYRAMGFDERFYLYCEDNDLCLKVRQKGWKVMYHPHAQGVHEESQSSRITPNVNNIMQESIRYFHEKWSWYFAKNPKEAFL